MQLFDAALCQFFLNNVPEEQEEDHLNLNCLPFGKKMSTQISHGFGG